MKKWPGFYDHTLEINRSLKVHSPFNINIMNYNHYQFIGMHLIWWFVWGTLIFWIFATPYNIPGQKIKNDSPLDILKKRLASSQISKEEYEEKKKILEV